MKKILIGIFIFLVLLIVAAPFLIPTKAISQKISAVVEEKLHKKTSIENIRFTIFPQLGLRISKLSIGQPKQSDYFVTLDSFFVQLQWMPLFKKQIHISTLEFTKPLVELYATKSTEPKPETKSDASTSNIQLNIQKLSIDQATFTMFDEKMKPTVHVEGFSEKLSFDYASNGTSTIVGTTLIPVLAVYTPMGTLGRDTRIEIKKNLQIDANNLNIQELKINLGNLPISLQGKILDYSGDKPSVDVQFSGGPSDIDNIIGLIPSNMISSEYKNIESNGNLFVDGKIKGTIDTKNAAESIQQSDFHIAMTLKNGSVKHPQLEKPMSNISFEVDVDPKMLQVKNFHTDFGQSKVDYSAKITNYLTNPQFEFITNTILDLKDVYALHQDLPVKDLKGSVSLSLKASGNTNDLKATNVNGTIQTSAVGLQYPEMKYDVENLNSVLKLEKNNINIQNVSMLINKSDLSLRGSLINPMAMMDDKKSSVMKFALQASSKNLNADTLMPPPDDSDAPVEMPDAFYKIDGNLGFIAQKLTFNKLDMTQAKGNIGIHNGIVEFKPVSVQVFNGTVSLNGTVNLKNRKKPAFDLNTELKNIQVQKALAYADNIDKLLRLHNSLKADIGLKAKTKGELLKDYSLNINTLDSSGSFSLSNAVIQNHPIQKAFSSYFNSNAFQNIDIKQWTQAFTIENGKVNVNNLSFGAKDFDFKVNGWQSVDGKNDFAIDAKLPQALVNKIADKLPAPVAALIGSQKSITLPFSVTGDATSPQLGLDSGKMGDVAKDQLKSQLKSEATKATSSLKSEAKKLVPTKKGTTPKKEDVKKKASDALKKLF